MKHDRCAVVLIVFVGLVVRAHAEPIPSGSGKITLKVANHDLELFTYKPANYKNGPLIVVFHGMLRNADAYRDNAVGMADRFGAVVVAPLFDLKRFPVEAYQSGGLFKKNELQPREEWTWSLVPPLVDAVRKLEGKPKMPYYLIGHSAGGQFLCRLTGFVPTEAERIVAANPGSHLFPNAEMPFPYGFGKLPASLNGEESLKTFLSRKMTIYVGTADVESANLPKGEIANSQGATRYERGKNCFKVGQELAKAKGWPFHWTLVEAEGIGHDAMKMFNHPNCEMALFGKK